MYPHIPRQRGFVRILHAISRVEHVGEILDFPLANAHDGCMTETRTAETLADRYLALWAKVDKSLESPRNAWDTKIDLAPIRITHKG